MFFLLRSMNINIIPRLSCLSVCFTTRRLAGARGTYAWYEARNEQASKQAGRPGRSDARTMTLVTVGLIGAPKYNEQQTASRSISPFFIKPSRVFARTLLVSARARARRPRNNFICAQQKQLLYPNSYCMLRIRSTFFPFFYWLHWVLGKYL